MIATISLVVVDRPPPLDVDRVAGASALSTSVRVAQAAFASSDTIVVADPSAPPGLVLSTALARSAPVLYVHGRSVPGDVVKEIARLGSDQAVAIALDDVVLARLAAVGLRVETVAPFAPAPSLDLQLQLLEDTDHETIWVGAEGRPADLVVAAAASFPDAGFATWRKGRPIDPSEGGARLMLVGGTAAIPGDAFDS